MESLRGASGVYIGTDIEHGAPLGTTRCEEVFQGMSSDQPYVTPSVRKLAAKYGVDLRTVTGTGVGGRIREKDVLAAAERAQAASSQAISADFLTSEKGEQTPQEAVDTGLWAVDSVRGEVKDDQVLSVSKRRSHTRPDVAREGGFKRPLPGLKDVCIGVVENGEDVALRYEDRDRGVAIIGKTGTGKSSLMEHLILADITHGTPGMVIDPHGLLAQRVLSLAPSEVAHRIFLLEVDETYPFGLNLLDVDKSRPDYTTWAADSVIATVKKLYGEADDYMPLLEKYLDLAVRALIPNNGTLVDVPRLFRDTAFRHMCLRRVTDEDVIGEFRVYESLRPAEQAMEVRAVINRLGRVVRSAAFKKILGSKKTTVPFNKVLSGETMLVVSLPSDVLSADRCDFIGSVLLCALADRVFARSAVTQVRRLHLYLDEYQRFATVTTQELLTQGRKFQAGVTMAHQDLYQITDPRVRNASRHAGTLIALALTRPDAEELAGEFPVEPKPEWTETVVEQDGWKSKQLLSSTPISDIQQNGHSDGAVVLAVRNLFGSPVRPHFDPDAPGKLVGELMLRGNVDREDLIRGVRGRYGSNEVPVYYEESFRRIMAGDLHSPELWGDELAQETSVLFGVLPPFKNRSPSRILERFHTCGKERRTPPPGEWRTPLSIMEEQAMERAHRLGWDPYNCRCNAYSLTAADRARNEEIWQEYQRQKEAVLRNVRKWIVGNLQDHAAFCRGEYTATFQSLDHDFDGHARGCGFQNLYEWVVRAPPAGAPADMIFNFAWFCATTPAAGSIRSLRERLRQIVILGKGLEREPIYRKSGEQEPNMHTRHIIHSGQTVQDALNEFASKLVHPPLRYVAHVRLPPPGGYHQANLAAPLIGLGSQDQVTNIRKRSQELYKAEPDDSEESETLPPAPPPTEPKPPITRWSPGTEPDFANTPDEEESDDDDKSK